MPSNNPKLIPELTKAELARFWKCVDIKENDCWNWKGHSYEKFGYGRFRLTIALKCRRRFLAHRIAYQLHNRRDPGDMLVLHECDNPSCVNPAHLKLGTSRDNTADMVDRGRARFRITTIENASRGESNGNSRLTEEIVRKMRQMYSSGDSTHRQIAERFGFGRSTVGYALKYGWKHVA